MPLEPLPGRLRLPPSALLIAAVAVIAALPGPVFASGFFNAGPMGATRSRAAASAAGGKVLLVGGTGYSGFCLPVGSAELYDPSTGLFTPTGSMSATRCEAKSVTLDSGRVLVVGGLGGGIGTAELFDPSTGRFSPAGPLNTARGFGFTLTLMADGRVLVAGGDNFDGTTDTAEVYDPNTNTFSSTWGVMTTPRSEHTSTLLACGKILLAGGRSGFTCDRVARSADLFDPANDTFTAVTSGPVAPLWGHAAARLPGGQVLLAGGEPDCDLGASFNGTRIAQVYDPTTDSFTATPLMSGAHGAGLSATMLSDGRVLIAGGWAGPAPAGGGELFDALTGAFTDAGALLTPRAFHVQIGLAGGRVILAGGEAGVSSATSSVEIFVAPPMREADGSTVCPESCPF